MSSPNLVRTCLFLAACLFFLPSVSRSEIVIKGLKLGMSIDEALEVVNSRIASEFGREVEIVGRGYTKFHEDKSVPGFKLNTKWKDTDNPAFVTVDIIAVEAGEDRMVNRIEIPGHISEKLFNAQDMSSEDFAKAIMDNYGVPELQATQAVTFGVPVLTYTRSP